MLADGIAAMALKENISSHHFNTLKGPLSIRSTSLQRTHHLELVDSLLETISHPKIRSFFGRVNLRVRPHVAHALDVADQKPALRVL
jgi:hypothetical protein